jgi:hypothetical protein
MQNNTTDGSLKFSELLQDLQLVFTVGGAKLWGEGEKEKKKKKSKLEQTKSWDEKRNEQQRDEGKMARASVGAFRFQAIWQ